MTAPTRRALLTGAAAASIAFWANPAAAYIASGIANTVAAAQLTTMTITETAGNSIAADFIPPMFGHPFKKGDIVAGTYPKFTLNDGVTAVPATIMNRVFWSDGSLKHASFLVRVPTTLAANGSLTLKIFSGGTAPAASGRSTSDLTAADLRLKATGLDNLSGDWTSILNDGIANTNQSFSSGGPDIVSCTDGAVGRVYRVRASFEQSGAAHGQMECYWYVAALQNAAGGLYGIRYLGRMTQPWYNSTNTPTRTFRSFSALQTLTGATPIRDLFATYLQPQTVTRSSGNQFNIDMTYLQSGMAVQLSTTGVMPIGLSAATTYWLHKVSATKAEFSTGSQQATAGNAIVAVSSDGTGVLTLTPVPYCCMFGSLWTAPSTATWEYIQGGGSIAADVTVRCSMNKTYWRSTRMVPSFDLTISPTSTTAQIMFPSWGGPVERATTTTGERADIGLFSSWYARHFLTQAAVDETVVRVVGLVGQQWSVNLKDTTTKSIPVVNNGSYSGMPTANNSFQWNPAPVGGSNVSGFTVPSNDNCLACFNNQDTTHIPAFSYYAYLLTGEPQFLDGVVEFAQNALYTRLVTPGTATVSGATNDFGGKRTVTISGTTRYGIALSGGLLRADAWALRDIAAATALQAGNPENASYGQYFTDLNTDNWAAAVAFNGIQTSFWLTNGLLGFQAGNKAEGPCTQGNWMQGYWCYANAFAYAVTENADALTYLSHPIKLFSWIRNNWSAWSVGSFQYLIRTVNTTTGPALTANSQFGIWGANTNTTWANGGHFTVSPLNNYVLTAGDVYNFVSNEGSIPGGFSANTSYYAVNIGVGGANTFDLAATLGGTPITPSNGGSTVPALIGAVAPPATGFASADDNDGYGANIVGALQYVEALGVASDTALISDMLTRMLGGGVSFVSNPKYGMTSSF